MKIHKVLFIFTAILFASCTTTNEFESADYDQLLDNPYPPISVHYLKNSSEFRRECYEYDQQSLLHHCRIDQFDLGQIYSALAESDQFSFVVYGNDQLDYELHLIVAGYNHEGGDDLGTAVLSGATLMLLPMSISSEIMVEAALMWQGFELKRYRYELPFTEKISILKLDQSTDRDVAEMVTSYLIKGFQDDDVFSPEFLFTAINASNYKDEFLQPASSASYLKTNEHRFSHPLSGVQTRYSHEIFPMDIIDTYVYPVPHWSYNDTEAVLQREILNVKDEIEIYARSSGLGEIEFNTVKVLQDDSAHPAVLFLRGQHRNEDDDLISTYVYLSVKEDKIVKFRSTSPSLDDEQNELFERSVENFVVEYMREVKVPDESLFMLQLRNRWRNLPNALN